MEGLAQLSKPTTNYLVLLLVFFSFAIPLASFASTAYTYDKNGNMTFDGANTYTYDAKNQLTQSVAGDVTTHYTYDYDGQRLSATAINAKKGTSITTYTPSKTYTEIVDNNNPTAPHKTITRILSPGGDWKEIETQGTVTTERYIYTDHLGNVQVVTDEKGAPIQIQDYKTFGSQDLNDTSGTYDSSRKYIGQEFDQDTGLLYLNARYYNPAIGRFLSQDPVFWAIGDEKEVRRLTGKSQQEIIKGLFNIEGPLASRHTDFESYKQAFDQEIYNHIALLKQRLKLGTVDKIIDIATASSAAGAIAQAHGEVYNMCGYVLSPSSPEAALAARTGFESIKLLAGKKV